MTAVNLYLFNLKPNRLLDLGQCRTQATEHRRKKQTRPRHHNVIISAQIYIFFPNRRCFPTYLSKMRTFLRTLHTADWFSCIVPVLILCILCTKAVKMCTFRKFYLQIVAQVHKLSLLCTAKISKKINSLITLKT